MSSGWWFGTFFIFPYIGYNSTNWLIFFRGVETTNQELLDLLLGFLTIDSDNLSGWCEWHLWAILSQYPCLFLKFWVLRLCTIYTHLTTITRALVRLGHIFESLSCIHRLASEVEVLDRKTLYDASLTVMWCKFMITVTIFRRTNLMFFPPKVMENSLDTKLWFLVKPMGISGS